jgi:hypothetical protein
MRVIQRHERLAGEGIPDFCAEVGTAGRCEGGIFGEPCTPDGALVSDERPDPVAGQAVAQHGVLIFACRDHVVLRAAGGGVQSGREAQVGDGSRVAVAGQGHRLRGTGCDDLALILTLESEVGHCYEVSYVWIRLRALCVYSRQAEMQALFFRDVVRRKCVSDCCVGVRVLFFFSSPSFSVCTPSANSCQPEPKKCSNAAA